MPAALQAALATKSNRSGVLAGVGVPVCGFTRRYIGDRFSSWLVGSLGRLGVILRRYEMKDKGSRDACRERDGCAPSPIGNDA